ncbi:sensor histidine kinase [Niabella insulamsoli]|uniref:sensor histidine kinase n=1 Tax=Niabella insulamsoli TaxID=3144874 RepID=UPI0031FDB495
MKAREIYNKIEFWIATAVAAGLFLGLLIESKNAGGHQPFWFSEYDIQYDFYKHFFLPATALIIIYYAAFIFLTRFVDEKRDDWAKAGSFFGTYLIVATLVAVSNTYLDGWKFGKFNSKDELYNDIFVDSFTTVAIIFILYIVYYLLKELLFAALARQPKARRNTKKVWSVVLAVASWVALMIIFGGNNEPGGVAVFGVGIPYIALLVWLHMRYLLPHAGNKPYKNKTYWVRALLITFLMSVLAGAICMGIVGSNDFAPPFFLFFFLTLFVALPLILYISRNRSEKAVLQSALGSSQANLSFLRSQINPHFLFNALNTLYGTALQENADRTSEGIQKLGDMMRFMLHENLQDKIALAREIDYLSNYIDLQKLRLATSPHLVLQTNIEQQVNRLDISPMLLIPFVENAFKHGISLQQPSYINISLHTKERMLYFDVTNSVHPKNEYDPEKMKSGIGLINVKQRLALLYPKKHELIIRESAKEFFVHLTIQL